MRRLVSGFSLIELMVVIAIVGIVMAIAYPSFTVMFKQNRALAFTNQLAYGLNLARSEAIKRGFPVTVCTADPTLTPLACDASKPWNGGWLIFVDVNGNATLDTGDTALKVGQPSSLGIAFTATNTASALAITSLVYLPSGAANNGSNSFVICATVSGQSAGELRTISLNNTGRVSITKGTC